MTRQSPGLLDLPAYAGAVEIARRYLGRTEEAARRLEKKGDSEALHDFRVSLRRLRSNLQAYAPYLATAVSPKRQRKIRKLAASTGGGRDAEVHLAWLESRQLDVRLDEAPGVELLRGALEERLEKGYGAAVSVAPGKFRKLDRRLRRRLDALETTARASGLDEGVRFGTALERALPEYASQLDAQLSRVHTPADELEAHRARIRGKRLRYLLEPLAGELAGVEDLLGRLEQLQDLLGELRDAQLLSGIVADLMESVRQDGPPEAEHGLARIADWLTAEKSLLFGRLRDTWLGDRSVGFFAAVEAVGASLVAAGVADVEIERKYLLSGLPPILVGRPHRELDQGYIPGERLQERVRRIRKDGEEWYVRTVKVGSGIRRIELQDETDRQTFEVLWPLTWGHRVAKRRYSVPAGRLVWEVDEFTDRDLVLAEVELPSEDMEPKLPDWIAPYVEREVTGEPEYLNVNLAC